MRCPGRRFATLSLAGALVSSCTFHVHLAVGVRHDGNRAAVHGGVAMAIGGDNSAPIRDFSGLTVGGGFDVDEAYGTSGTVDVTYLGGGPGPLVHTGRVSGLVGHAVKLGGGLSYPIVAQRRDSLCLICKADRERNDTTAFAALGALVSGMADKDGVSVAGDLVLDLVP